MIFHALKMRKNNQNHRSSFIVHVIKDRVQALDKGARSKNSPQSPRWALHKRRPTLRPLRIWGDKWGRSAECFYRS